MDRAAVAVTTVVAFVVAALIVISVGGALLWIQAARIVGGARP